jgi:hypothetical protein
MAPTPDQLVETLKSTVDKLEARVAELEARLQGKSPGSAGASSDGMRMVLMGPPGAGMFHKTSIFEGIGQLAKSAAHTRCKV